MSSGQPYNSLGQILSEGGEQALAMAIFNDIGADGILLLFRRRFEPITDSDRQDLTALANAGLAAGSVLTAADPFELMDVSQMPVNPFLWGGEAAGRRIRIIGEWQFEEGK